MALPLRSFVLVQHRGSHHPGGYLGAYWRDTLLSAGLEEEGTAPSLGRRCPCQARLSSFNYLGANVHNFKISDFGDFQTIMEASLGDSSNYSSVFSPRK